MIDAYTTNLPRWVVALQNFAPTEQRAVYGALVTAGKPVTNAELARPLGVSPGEASKRVSRMNGLLRVIRTGREKRIALPV